MSYPSDTTMTKVTIPNMARPGYLSPTNHPVFKTRITRVADQSAFKISERCIRHVYSKNQPWNSDGSLVMLDYIYPAPILDGKTYKFLRRIRQPSQAVWSNTDPNKTYGTDANKFVSVNMTTNEFKTLHTFSEYDSISLGEGEGNLSKDERYVALQAKKGSSTYMLVYDILSDKVVSTHNLGGLWPNSVSMSQSGKYVVVDWAGVATGTQRNAGLEVFDRSLNFLRQLAPYTNHGDIGYDTSGDEVFVMRSNDDWSITAIRLDNGVQKSVLKGTDTYRLGSNWSNHISCRNIKRPGWCYYTDEEPSSESKSMAHQEVIAIKLDGSQTVERFAHTYHSDGIGYEAQPMAVPNRDGSKVMWASEWKGGSSAPVYSYVAEMP